MSLFYDSKSFAKNSSYQKDPTKFDLWYSKVWNEYENDPDTSQIRGRLKSAYSHYHKQPKGTMYEPLEAMILGHPHYTTYTADFKETLDYIFHSDK